MTDETPDLPPVPEKSPEVEPPAADKPAGKKAARKRPARKKAAKAPKASDFPSPDPVGEKAGSKPTAAAEPVVDVENGIETRETESENARRVSSKRVAAPAEPVAPEAESAGESPRGSSDPEEEQRPVIGEPEGGDDASGGGKRRRRRRRRGGADDGDGGDSGARQRPALDPDKVASKAWKIFKAEVGEEGLALINDSDARELSRRSFRLAEIFLEEAARRQ